MYESGYKKRSIRNILVGIIKGAVLQCRWSTNQDRRVEKAKFTNLGSFTKGGDMQNRNRGSNLTVYQLRKEHKE